MINFPNFTITPVAKVEQDICYFVCCKTMQCHLYPNSMALLKIKDQLSILIG